MHVFSRTYHVPKAGTSKRDYEDAAYPAWLHDSCTKEFRCAVADGATESSFSREWARRLVRHFGHGTLDAQTCLEVIPKLQQRWQRQVGRRPLAWFAEEAASRGAFAAFVGMVIWRTGRGQRLWSAIALGDACLFLVRQDRLHAAFPLETAEDFNNRPFLLSTHSNRWPSEHAAMRHTQGAWHTDDEFYLMTDALAQWFLHEHEGGRKPWAVLRDLDTDAQTQTFDEYVDGLRGEKRIRNDDTTLVRVNVAG